MASKARLAQSNKRSREIEAIRDALARVMDPARTEPLSKPWDLAVTAWFALENHRDCQRRIKRIMRNDIAPEVSS